MDADDDEIQYVSMTNIKKYVPNSQVGENSTSKTHIGNDTFSSFDSSNAENCNNACRMPKPEPSRYLYDRCTGNSLHGEHKFHPRCCICFVPIWVYHASPIFEQNIFCRWFGSFGIKSFQENAAKRTRWFRISLIVNLVCFVLTLFACFAASQDFDTLRSASFSHGTMTLKANGEYIYGGTISIDVGLTAVAVGYTRDVNAYNNGDDDDGDDDGANNNYNYIPADHVLLFNEFCDKMDDLERIQNEEQCDNCQEISGHLVKSTIISAITVVPTVATDVTRMYPNYDVNCQKFSGTIMATISFLTSLFTLFAYRQHCFVGFYDGAVTLYTQDENGDQMEVDAYFTWGAGAGHKCLLAATYLKVVDIVLNAITPTPAITRSLKLQKEYEKLSSSSRHTTNTNTSANLKVSSGVSV